MWSLDADYDNRSLMPHQVFFPMADAKGGWNRLRKTVRAELDEDLLEQFHGTVSLPFEAGDGKRIAVKIVDDRGIESLKSLKNPPRIYRFYPSQVLNYSLLGFKSRFLVPAVEQGIKDAEEFFSDTGRFLRFRHDPDDPSSLSADTVFSADRMKQFYRAIRARAPDCSFSTAASALRPRAMSSSIRFSQPRERANMR